ncbi:MAG TPA: T9SS type A sorting domain-containing protein, partial [Candidatus Marinimicrobia bacterium]|nr:T9SS type A sorting domain-containing protein [Candidatus Neomarinimicrobiota bacterium]
FHNLYKIETLSSNTTLNPINIEINQIYPNPFNPTTTIRYGLNQNAIIQISIYDINGGLITTLINEFQIAGYHFITWDASNYSSGIYFLNMFSGEISETKKMVLIK